jgi:ubiquitin carboxyl-terminal hydrolase 8
MSLECSKKDFTYNFYVNHEIHCEKSKYVRRGLCGLVNAGNKCFLNSIVQCLSHTLKLTDFFLSQKYKEEDPEHMNKRKTIYVVVQSYITLLHNLWDTNQVIVPRSFVENMSKLVKKYYTLEQQDSHECLMYILDALHKGLSYEIDVNIRGEVKNESDKLMKMSLETWKSFYEKEYSYILETFNGMIYNRIECLQCGDLNVVDQFEPYNSLSIDIDINKVNSLNDLLKKHFHESDTIKEWHCDKCKQDTGCKKSSKLWAVPNYLIIHLKRFDNTGKKINSDVKFPLTDLDLTEFISKEKGDPNNYIYTLYAVNYHSGTLDDGHYWSSCKNLDDNWYKFNDANVVKVNQINDIQSKDAYILFYYRKFLKKSD